MCSSDLINFSKSTLVPMHVADADLQDIQSVLGCRVEGFPQTYLGLPLSAHKLTLHDFAPLIAKVDKYLSGWTAILLSTGGRLVLLNAVLDALPIFAMGAMELPPALLSMIEGLRRAFLWDAADRPSGAKCLVAWTAVCRPKREGGLGIKLLKEKNSCLQMKLVHRLHVEIDAPWSRWFWARERERSEDGHHLKRLSALMPLYRNLTTCKVGDGRTVSFWLDTWVGDAPLCARFESLFSHALKQEITVQEVLEKGLSATLVPRLNTTGTAQFPLLLSLIADVSLSSNPDSRRLTRCAKPSGALDTAALYTLCTWGGVDAPYCEFIWSNFAPSKVKLFGWLLSRARIQSRSELFKKQILTEEEAICPICCELNETANHIIFACPFARCFWAAIDCRFPVDADVKDLHAYAPRLGLPLELNSTFVLLCCWNLWKHRNGVVFQGRQPNLHNLIRSCKGDVLLWRARLPRRHEQTADAWLTSLDS